MLHFVLDYAKRDEESKKLKLHCGLLGMFDVLSGEDPYINIPECSFKSGAAIPPGKYWIVDRPEGSIKNKGRAMFIDNYKKIAINEYTPPHKDWFGLFNSKTMANDISIYNISRGSFCLHPLNGDGSGVSEGCITFYEVNDFKIVRNALLRQRKTKVSAAGRTLEVYGYIDVINSPTIHDYYHNGHSPTIQEYLGNNMIPNSYNQLLQEERVKNPMLRENVCYRQAESAMISIAERRRIKKQLVSDMRTNSMSVILHNRFKY